MKIWLGNSIRLPLLPRLEIIQAIPLALGPMWPRRPNQPVARPQGSKRRGFPKNCPV